MSRLIPLSIPNFEGNERKYVDEAIEAGWVSTGGAFITKMEEQLASFIKAPGVACCQSGTSAVHLALVETGVKPGDVVLVPSITFIAAVNPVRYQFAQPIFIDCDGSLCMDPVKLRQFCKEECYLQNNQLVYKPTGKIVKAVVVVHVFGNIADMESIMDIAEMYHLKVIEDATEALGSRYTDGPFKGRFAGTIGDYGAFSFNGNKIITTGGGGAITASTLDVVEHLKYLSTQAKDDPHYYIHNEVGYNYRMTNLQAALGVAQMEELSLFIERKHKIYELYKQLFKDFELGMLLPFREGTYSNQWFISIQLSMEKVRGELRDIITCLEDKGVQTRAIWGLINEQQPYLNELAYRMERAPFYSKCILNIPSSTQLTEDDVKYAAGIIMETLREISHE